jgi:hypothetical protein
MGATEREREALLVELNIAANALSVIGGLVIVASYLRFRELRRQNYVILLHLGLADVLTGLANLTPPPEDGTPGCASQGYFLSMFNLASAVWTLLISVNLYRIVIRRSVSEW